MLTQLIGLPRRLLPSRVLQQQVLVVEQKKKTDCQSSFSAAALASASSLGSLWGFISPLMDGTLFLLNSICTHASAFAQLPPDKANYSLGSLHQYKRLCHVNLQC